jgi:hypothetical protein
MMKSFMKKVALLALLLGILIPVLNYLGLRAGKIYKDGAAQVCEIKRRMVRSGAIHYIKDKDNVLFLGTSRILAGITPTYFDELNEDKTYSYNLALPGLPISSSYFVLREYLEQNPPPQYVVMQLYINRCRSCNLYNYYAVQGLESPAEILSLFKHMDNKAIIFNYIFPFRMYKFHTARYLFDSIIIPARIRSIRKKNNAILNRMIENRGYYFIEEQAVAANNMLPDDFAEEGGGGSGESINKASSYDPFVDPYVKLFFDLARDHGVKVLLIQPPYRERQYLQYEEMPLQYAVLLKEYKNVRIAQDGWKLKFYENRFFSDPTHLNKEGALRYTGEIYQEFKETFLL